MTEVITIPPSKWECDVCGVPFVLTYFCRYYRCGHVGKDAVPSTPDQRWRWMWSEIWSGAVARNLATVRLGQDACDECGQPAECVMIAASLCRLCATVAVRAFGEPRTGGWPI